MDTTTAPVEKTAKPQWLRVKLPTGKNIQNYVAWWINTSSIPFVPLEVALIWGNVGDMVRLLL